MDSKDREIIRELQLNGRLTNQELSDRVNLSPSPCLRRLRALEAEGVITGYTALVDQELFGLPLTVFIQVSLDKHDEKTVGRFEDYIRKIDEILECWMTTGDADYLLRVVASSIDDYEKFIRTRLHRIPGVGSIDTSFAYGRIKRSFVYPNKE
ncbi:MAG: Lrp/AsnC family transcriptional regulator [Pseudomonadota bacterium]